MDIFEKASRRKLRFAAAVGRITTEDLWDLPLMAGSRATRDVKMDLDTVSRTALLELQQYGDTASLVNPTPTAGKEDAELRVEILKHVIASKQAEEDAKKRRAANAAEAARLREALAQKQEQKLVSMDEEAIRARLAELGADA